MSRWRSPRPMTYPTMLVTAAERAKAWVLSHQSLASRDCTHISCERGRGRGRGRGSGRLGLALKLGLGGRLGLGLRLVSREMRSRAIVSIE